jgi:16S rRNA (guanine527-N7)-methyltransferase
VNPIEKRLGLGGHQLEQLRAFQEMAQEINRRHNLYSEASAGAFWTRHVRHSLALATRSFPDGATVVDWGTGGGLPGLPLAIVFPNVRFVLVDSVTKKIQAVRTMVRRLGLDNVEAWAGRAETWDGRAHYSVSRATAPLRDLWGWTHPILEPLDAPPAAWRQGLITLKGGNLDQEIRDLADEFGELALEGIPLEPLLADAYFREKQILAVYS